MTGAAANVRETAREVTEVSFEARCWGRVRGPCPVPCPTLRGWVMCAAGSSPLLKAAVCAVLASTIPAFPPHILLHTCALLISR